MGPPPRPVSQGEAAPLPAPGPTAAPPRPKANPRPRANPPTPRIGPLDGSAETGGAGTNPLLPPKAVPLAPAALAPGLPHVAVDDPPGPAMPDPEPRVESLPVNSRGCEELAEGDVAVAAAGLGTASEEVAAIANVGEAVAPGEAADPGAAGDANPGDRACRSVNNDTCNHLTRTDLLKYQVSAKAKTPVAAIFHRFLPLLRLLRPSQGTSCSCSSYL